MKADILLPYEESSRRAKHIFEIAHFRITVARHAWTPPDSMFSSNRIG